HLGSGSRLCRKSLEGGGVGPPGLPPVWAAAGPGRPYLCTPERLPTEPSCVTLETHDDRPTGPNFASGGRPGQGKDRWAFGELSPEEGMVLLRERELPVEGQLPIASNSALCCSLC